MPLTPPVDSKDYAFDPDPATPSASDASAIPLHPILPDVVCFAHLHWDFVWQRPQHLMSRFAQQGRVFYVEEAFFHNDDLIEPHVEVKERQHGLKVLVVHLPNRLRADEGAAEQVQFEVLTRFFDEQGVENFIGWYYTPMALGKSRRFQPALTVYDCMDELAAFKFAPPTLQEREQELFQKADLVFTGGHTLYEAKRQQHPDAHPFPSSIDKDHFGQARRDITEPADQANIAHPRIGFFGVVDERLDIELLGQLAETYPEWQFVIIGPVVKIDPATLPRHANIHYLGGKDYQELPAYLRGWDVATLLFADNESTKFISPTKTPEYLAAGRPVVSTPIRDVVRPYGELDLVQIAATADEFGQAIEKALTQTRDADWQRRTDEYLATISWDLTWEQMVGLMQSRLQAKTTAAPTAAAASMSVS
ncbi:glycosyltransferase family 1 protein [Microvirga sp. STR05]|uniref:Glycosyltransferase family 1 protein n=1 Tax=Hymenobacter duratus TaxID=2771356 RepID=A0ABR8JEL8_9BACT|nr:glycosyltransferase family 1 protein [Hymenobacter duratus]MBD2714477.1 glycosyltransferase family 1 protein [Hymenobacter duratus]MBR7949381.1 glycosyltransferase family 1 protein [Microvirga sp. STR05]